MPAKSPLIGITTDYRDKYFGIEATYSASVASFGGIPFLIPSLYRNKRTLRELTGNIDGLLIPGSRDMDPEYYGQKPGGKLNPMSIERTKTEFIVLEESIRNKVPVLGICGGMQFINVFFGGSLYQDIKSLIPAALNHEKGAKHSISILKNSVLGSVIGIPRIEVNSFHHQAVKKIGRGLTASAHSGDKIVEALESRDNNILAVQWHPELRSDSYSEKLFSYFIGKASAYRAENRS